MKFILNADDFGRTQTVNEAIVKGFKLKCLDRTTIMVNMPFFNEAVDFSEKENFKNKVGLHINLTSGIPLSEPIKECPNFCTDGMFNGKIFRSRNVQLRLAKNEKIAVYKEITTQIEQYLAAGFELRHADSHGHVHTYPALVDTVIKCLLEYNFVSVRISANTTSNIVKQMYKKIINRKLNVINSKNDAKCDYFDSFLRIQKKFGYSINSDYCCEIMLHPNIWDGEVQVGESMKYEDVMKYIEFWRGKDNE